MKFFKKKNKIEECADLISEELEKAQKRQGTIFGGTRVNRDHVLSFVVAELYFEITMNPKFKDIKFKPEYQEFIDKEKRKAAFDTFYRGMIDDYKGKSHPDRSIFNSTLNFLTLCLSIPKEKVLRNPAARTFSSLQLAMTRDSIINYVNSYLIKEISYAG